MTPPSPRTRVLILGGAPAGSTAASLLARNGIEVKLIEREIFPRHHSGESLLPSCLEIADLIGARELIEKEGFQRKPGAYLEWGRESWSSISGSCAAGTSTASRWSAPASTTCSCGMRRSQEGGGPRGGRGPVARLRRDGPPLPRPLGPAG